jgi:hypothetical protein
MREDRGRVSHLCQSGRQACAPFPGRACPLSALMGRTAGSQCVPSNGRTGDDQTVRCPSRLCHLARPGDGLNRGHASMFSLLGHACFSEWSPTASFPHFSPLLPFSFSLPLFLPSLTSSTPHSARLSLTRAEISSSTTSLRNSWVLAAWHICSGKATVRAIEHAFTGCR